MKIKQFFFLLKKKKFKNYYDCYNTLVNQHQKFNACNKLVVYSPAFLFFLFFLAFSLC